jgi:hypothetical protein
MTPDIGKAIVPICWLLKDDIGLDRTGVLFQVGESHFLLTASHGIKALLKENIPLFIPVISPEADPIPLVGSLFRGIDECDVDVVVAELDHETAYRLSLQNRFLRFNELDVKDHQNDGLYLVCGFPQEWFRKEQNVRPKAMVFFGRKYVGELNPLSHFDPGVHLVVGYERQGCSAIDNEPALLPKVNGMSGCGIWRILEWPPQRIESWEPSHCKLVAIQHSWDENRSYIKGTWVRHALSLIYHNYPQHQAALTVAYR